MVDPATDLTGDAPAGPIKAVTFDFWHTLAVPMDGTGAALRARLLNELVAEETGAPPDDPERTMRAVVVARDAHTATWLAGDTDYWDPIADLVAAEVGLPAGDRGLRRRVRGILAAFPPDAFPSLTPNVAGTVRALADAGVGLGIVCDVGLTPSTQLRRTLDHHGLLDAFTHTSFSDDVGAFKPDRRIFEDVLAGLGGPDPSTVAHVGDLRRTDVAGARAMGMTAVRYSGSHDDPGDAEAGTDRIEGHHLVADHADLPAALGLA